MTQREEKKKWIFYPEDKYKGYWDLFITLILLVTCINTPIQIAFTTSTVGAVSITDDMFSFIIDLMFLADICVIFNSAYYTEDMDMVDDRKMIAKTYLYGWFTIDFLAIMPFDLILNATDFSSLVRVARFGKLYKLVKLTRLLRILKIMKEKNKLLKYLNEFLKLGLGFERLFFFILIFFILIHIVTCLWIITGTILSNDIVEHKDNLLGVDNDKVNLPPEVDYTGTWLSDYATGDHSNTDLYAIAFYWTVTTITTVGYGDISGTNNLERIFGSLIMIVGVISFSFANGSLASIIQNYDQTNAIYQEKLVILNRIYKEYSLPLSLFIRLKKSMGYESKKDMHDLNKFLEELPHKLKIEVSLYVYEQRYNKIKFFRNRNVSFILWMCPLLKPQFFQEN